MSKIVFFDIDGTLLDDEKKICETTKDAIKKLKENDIHVAIATGRAPFMIKPLLEELGIDTYVTYNGQYVVHNGEAVFRNPIKKELLQKLEEEAAKNNHPMVFMDHLDMKANIELHDHIRDSFASLKMVPPSFHETYYHDRDIYQALLFFDRNEDNNYQYRDTFNECHFIRWHDYSVDILPAGGSKAKGIEKLLAVLEIEKENAYAFGDATNDLEMIAYVGTGVAMGNAMPEVKKVANYVTKSNNDKGIYHGLKELGLIDQ
jgi:Cof subfamily protein (haloacid dehalogenase superfamily)